MTAEQILEELWTRNITQTELAKRFGVSHVMIHQVIYGKSRSRRIQAGIVKILGRELEEVFPNRWKCRIGQNVSATSPILASNQ